MSSGILQIAVVLFLVSGISAIYIPRSVHFEAPIRIPPPRTYELLERPPMPSSYNSEYNSRPRSSGDHDDEEKAHGGHAHAPEPHAVLESSSTMSSGTISWTITRKPIIPVLLTIFVFLGLLIS
ncbi:uncharacterized protein LOC129589734 [Paramacrobiotus metropolitanus]|uniref:uncharacterized protein LOC129589734 n=1 Tax=Paramacrobiotus metropolitanus TaxID=2943436 RepID=UPI002445FA17|nr:uncharacterized protein LOC129589734 [Paramacrobiotus metropolitanus]